MEGDKELFIEIEMSALVYPTEDEGKVLRAMQTIVPFSEEDVEVYGDVIKEVVVRKEGYESLIKLRSSFRNNRVLDTARSLLITSRGKLKTLLFHKQAAYVGKVRLCDDDSMSPLGTIRLKIRYEGDPIILANWLTPRTEKGKIVEEATTRELLYGRADID